MTVISNFIHVVIALWAGFMVLEMCEGLGKDRKHGPRNKRTARS